MADHFNHLHFGSQGFPNKPEQTAEVLKFFDWAYKNGGKEANALDYATLPESVVEQVRAAWEDQRKGQQR
ncbi:phosphate ABC transporter [Klebsiella michiganensis]|uniref:Phosphate ABC transporter n=1 Tax=Klebsiella michiganensis TaxID=1134687 RepID=A0A7H4PET8_9ENTR|nr:phosphate ABC transporter [Klebsiella michiganensis]